jgi:P27 family predicted phage terminase small subunit
VACLQIHNERPGSPTPLKSLDQSSAKGGTSPPGHLSDDTKSWWRSAVKNYALEEHHLRLLQAACESWDRLQQAREAINKDGITFRDDRGNLRAHPAVAIEKDARIGFARLVRELDLDCEPPASGRSRPPALASNRR